MNLNEFLNNFNASNDIIDFKTIETFKLYTAFITFNTLPPIDSSWFELVTNKINSRDTLLSLSISLNDCEPIILEDDFENFIEEVEVDRSTIDDIKTICLKIEVSKILKNNTLSIYSLDDFADYLNNLNLSQLITNFYNIHNKNSYCYFEIQDDDFNIVSHTNFLCFKPINNSFEKTFEDYSNNVEKRKSVCSLLNTETFDFEPDNFSLSFSINNKIDNIFAKLKITYSLISLFNVSKIKDNLIKLKLNGYKFSKFCIDFNDIDISKIYIYYEIYQWVYSNDTISDKLEIVRNIISLYLMNSNNGNNVDLDSSVFSAIKSNYRIYLKENVDKYLELKSKIIETQLSINESISKLSDTVTDGFIKNLAGVGTFIITIIVMKSLDDKKFSDIFTKDITVLSIGLIFISIIYLIYNIRQSKNKVRNLIKNYCRFKHSYDDILLKKDINNIFKKDKFFKKDIKNIKSTIRFYTIIWIAFLIIIIIITFILGFQHFYNFFKLATKYFLIIYKIYTFVK